MGVGGHRHALVALPPGKRLGGPQGQSGQARKISTAPGFDPRTVQSAVSRYTNCAILAQIYIYILEGKNSCWQTAKQWLITSYLSTDAQLYTASTSYHDSHKLSYTQHYSMIKHYVSQFHTPLESPPAITHTAFKQEPDSHSKPPQFSQWSQINTLSFS